MLFEKVVPRLPAGWEWAEDEWRIDMTGLEEEGVDAEGWSYTMDFRCVLSYDSCRLSLHSIAAAVVKLLVTAHAAQKPVARCN